MEIGLPNIIKHVQSTSITGQHLLHVSEDEIIQKLRIREDEEVNKIFLFVYRAPKQYFCIKISLKTIFTRK